MAKGVNERHIFSGSSRKNRIKLKIKYQNEKNNNFFITPCFIGRFVGAIFRKKQNANTCQDVAVMIWYNGISCVPVVIIPENGRKSEYLLVGSCKDSVLISMA